MITRIRGGFAEHPTENLDLIRPIERLTVPRYTTSQKAAPLGPTMAFLNNNLYPPRWDDTNDRLSVAVLTHNGQTLVGTCFVPTGSGREPWIGPELVS